MNHFALMAWIILSAMALPSLVWSADTTTTATGVAQSSPAQNVALSEHFHQPDSGGTSIALSPRLATQTRRITVDGESRTYERSVNVLGVAFEHGISKSVSLGFATELGEATGKWSTRDWESRFRGPSDLIFGLNILSGLNSETNLVVRLETQISPQAQMAANRNVIGNRYSGGHTFAPSIGIESRMSSDFVFGGRTSYQIKGDSKTEYYDSTGHRYPDSTFIGGNILGLDLFSEFQKPAFTFGLHSKLEFEERYQEVYDGNRTNYDPRNWLLLGTYGKIAATPQIEIIPALQYQTTLSREVDGYTTDSNDTFSFHVSGRLSL